MRTRDRMPDRFRRRPPATRAGFVRTLPFELSLEHFRFQKDGRSRAQNRADFIAARNIQKYVDRHFDHFSVNEIFGRSTRADFDNPP